MESGVSGVIETSFRRIVRYAAGGFAALALVSCGGGGGSPGKVAGSSASGVGSISLIFSSSELKSAGTTGTEVTVTALVKNGNNAAVPDIPVTFTASSGALTVTDKVSDKNGQAKATLGTSGDHTNRRITVSAVAGGITASGTVDVVGTSISVVGPSTITAGSAGDLTITVKDSSGVAVSNVPVGFSSLKGNPISVKTSNGGSSSAPLTNAQGQVVLSLTASQSGNDIISVSSQGVSSSVSVNVNASKLNISIVDSSGSIATTAETTTACLRIASRYEVSGVAQTGTVNITTSRGRIYSDGGCATLLSTSNVAVTAGDSQAVYLKSDTAGVATVTASVVNGPTAQANVEFIAALTSSATISLQAEPAVIGTNSGVGQSERSTLTAIVRDGTTNNNLVKNAVVEFSIVSDKSGGALTNPSVITTASNGSASVAFIAGTADTPKDGVSIQAKIQGTSKTAVTSLTVSRKSLFIAAGTGSTLGTPTTTTYQQDYSVFVTDASGNPVPNVSVTATIIPTRYSKGTYTYDAVTAKRWVPDVVATCANEDVNQNGILDTGEDANSSGTLDPGIPLSITSSGTTDTTGTAIVSVRYPRDRGNWTEVKMTIRGSVSGTESTYIPPAFFLPVLITDLTSETAPPPGFYSPYGVNPCNIPN